ncbi:MAG: hypothetical protein E6047_05610 [Mogibacterium sp.]|nr:hypothetical protein [Mogibacterium sp.]
MRRTKANPGAVSGEAAIRPLIAKAVQLMSKPPETTHFSHEWRRVATWGFANGAQTTRADSLTMAGRSAKTVLCQKGFTRSAPRETV